MADKTLSIEQKRTKEGNVVIPLDELRTYDHGNLAITSGAFPGSGIIYSIASGKEAYIRQIQIKETDDTAGEIQLAKVVSGDYSAITPPIDLAGGQTKVVDTVIGPLTSGIATVSGYVTTSMNVTLSVQVDPKAVE